MEHLLSDVKVAYIKKFLQTGKILDVGAGECLYSKWIKSFAPLCEVSAVDRLTLKPQDGLNYVQADIEQGLPFATEQFNTIFAFDIIEHIEQEHFLMQELYRVTSSGGVIIGSVPHDNDLFLPKYNLTFNHRSDLTHKRYYTKNTLESLLIENGFTPIQVNLKGGINLQIIAEFFPASSRYLIRKIVGLMRRLGIISTRGLSSDIFFIALKA